MTYRIGIDAGSKTVKVIVLDEEDEVVFATYRRHQADICRTLEDALHDLTWRKGDLEGTVAITGSAGISVAEQLGVPFVQEVVATTHVVRHLYPEADAVIELGGEDAKVIYLAGDVEQRMNATCAGGTGGFIDTIAFMLGVRPSQMSQLANGARRIYPIASRCAVFAQTDVRPLLNAGASKADIAASAFDAVVRQTLGGLACGRPIRGTVVFLGGPLEHMPYLVQRFRRALGLNARNGIKPRYAHTLTARGAAMLSQRECTRTFRTGELEQTLANMQALEDDLEHLPPLFEGDLDIEEFRLRHAHASFPRKRLFDATGSLYVGIDAGSTTVKLAVLDSDRNLVHSAYEPTRGDTLGVLRDMLLELHSSLPRPYRRDQEPYAHIAHVTATGYGEDLLQAALGVDSGVVETAAHLRAAQRLCPDVSFVLDIGGQDMKALWVRDGQIADAVLNEACSSGCGSFIEGTSYSLKSTPWRFAEEALHARNPVDLGTKCTVFMTSRVRHAQKIGAPIGDIAAGIAYSVVSNALYRIIGADRIASMGERIVVQGGAFKSDAVLRAFELTCGKEVLRPEQAHLMGAIGAALVAAERAEAASQKTSTLISREELDALTVRRRSTTCTGCLNACALSVVEFGEGRAFITGNKCERGSDELERQAARTQKKPTGKSTCAGTARKAARDAGTSGAAAAGGAGAKTGRNASAAPKPPNIVATQQRMIRAFGDLEQSEDRGKVRVGVMNTLEMYEIMPFWHTLLAALGFSVAVPSAGCEQSRRTEAWETVPSESVCYAAKITHARYFSLVEKNVDAVLMTRFNRGVHCPVSCSYADALADNLAPSLPRLVTPLLASYKPARIVADENSHAALYHALAPLAEQAGAPLCRRELDRALDRALETQRQFQDDLEHATRQTADWLAGDASRHGIVLAGRPYHNDAALMHGIDEELQRLGFAVLPDAGLAGTLRAIRERQKAAEKTEQHQRERAESKDSRQQETPHNDEGGASPWRPAKHLVRTAQWVCSQPQLDMICLQSFGCGFDAMSIEEAREVLDAAHRPYTALKIDDISDTAHIRIRLRTLAEAIESRSRRSKAEKEGDDAKVGASSGDGAGANAKAALCSHPSTTPNEAAGALPADAHLLDAPLGPADLEVARHSTVKDVCFTANVMAARAIALVRKNPALKVIHMPHVCEECLTEAIPRMVERATGTCPRFMWDDTWPGAPSPEPAPSPVSAPSASAEHAPAFESTPDPAKAAGASALAPAPTSEATTRPRIGIVGNPLLCFEPYMNDGILDMLRELGCEPVLPDPALLITEDVRYLPQLEAFEKAGVHDVIYLQSFGCLKGHVHARGALHELRRRFPAISITVIDFDPEASALNRENRVRLAVEAAWEKTRVCQGTFL